MTQSIPDGAPEGKELSWVIHDHWANWFQMQFGHWPTAEDMEGLQNRYGPCPPRWAEQVIRLTDSHLLSILEALRDGRPVSRLALADHESIYAVLKKHQALIYNGHLVWLSDESPAFTKKFVSVMAHQLLERVDPLRNEPRIQAIRKQFAEESS